MNLYFHIDKQIIEKYNYDFSINDFYRLPMIATGNLQVSKARFKYGYIRMNNNYSYNVCVMILDIVKNNGCGLVTFLLESKIPNMFFSFFMEFPSNSNIDINIFKKNQYYEGNIKFHLGDKMLQTISNGVWNKLEKTSRAFASPFAVTKIQQIFDGNGKIYNKIEKIQQSYIVEAQYLCLDEIMQHITSYSDIDNKIEMKQFGSFSFGIIHYYMSEYPCYIFQFGNDIWLLFEIFNENFEDVLREIKNDNWILDDGYAVNACFENISFSFCKIDIPKCGWDEDYEVEYDILVRYGASSENTIATMTNITEFNEFVEWIKNIKEKYINIINLSEKKDIRFIYKNKD